MVIYEWQNKHMWKEIDRIHFENPMGSIFVQSVEQKNKNNDCLRE